MISMGWLVFLLCIAALFGFRVFALCVLIYLLFGLGGCATWDKETAEYNMTVAQANWAACELKYRDAGVPTYHHDHVHNVYKNGKINKHDMFSDLLENRCRQVLGSEWIEYAE